MPKLGGGEAINPANLRWYYLIRSLIDGHQTGPEEKVRLSKCLVSLKKYPISLSNQADHMRVLEHFNSKIVGLLKAADGGGGAAATPFKGHQGGQRRDSVPDFGCSPIVPRVSSRRF